MTSLAKVFLFLCLSLLYSCSSQNLNQINLETIDGNFNSMIFFEDKLALTNKILNLEKDSMKLSKEEALNLIFNNPYFLKDTLCYYESKGRYSDKYYIESKSLSSLFERDKVPFKIFGYQYSTISWDEKNDSLAFINNVYFPCIEAVSSPFLGQH